MALLEIRDLSFAYTREAVITGLSLSISPAEMVAVAGPNGSGKSTLLRLLSGSLVPDQGEILLAGKRLGEIGRRELARTIALVPQHTRLDMPYTAAEVVLMGRAPYLGRLGLEGPADVAIARRAMEQTGTLDLATRPFSDLSGGERQRVVVARALAQRPSVLLLDEPTAHLDLRHQIAILELIAELNEERGLTVIAAMHDLNLAALYFRRLVFLKKGRICAEGPIPSILDRSHIREVFEAEIAVARNPATGSVAVLPLRPVKERERIE